MLTRLLGAYLNVTAGSDRQVKEGKGYEGYVQNGSGSYADSAAWYFTAGGPSCRREWGRFSGDAVGADCRAADGS